MVDIEHYIKEGLKIIDKLIEEGNLQAALSGCQELLKVNPYHRKLQKYLKKIEERILAKNEKKVDADIDATMHLWKEERYDDLLKIYTKLYQYAPQHSRLQKLIQKVNEKLSRQQKNERASFVAKALTAIDGLYRENRFGDTIQACNELLAIDPMNREAEQLAQKAKDSLISQKLKENERVTEGADLERALDFYATLLSIDPNSTTVKNRVLQTKAQLAQRTALAAKIHFNESVARMKDLFQHAEYEKVIQACEEIGHLDPGNWSAKIFKKKSLNTIRKETNCAMVEKLKEAWRNLEPEYRKNPGAFLHI